MVYSLCTHRHRNHLAEPPRVFPYERRVKDRGQFWGPVLKPQDSCASGGRVGMVGCNSNSLYYINRNKRDVYHRCRRQKHPTKRSMAKGARPPSAASAPIQPNRDQRDRRDRHDLRDQRDQRDQHSRVFVYVFFGLCAILAIVLLITLAS